MNQQTQIKTAGFATFCDLSHFACADKPSIRLITFPWLKLLPIPNLFFKKT